MDNEELIPVPKDPYPQPDECRLWIGNIDIKITEYTILKVLQKFGELKRFDFVYHKSGPEKGKSKGYCFVTYHTKEEASKALRKVNGKLALYKKLIVRWAHVEPDTFVSVKQSPVINATSTETQDVSVDSRIKEIEAKLYTMEKTQKEFTVSSKLEAAPGTSRLSAIHIANVTKIQKTKPYSKKTCTHVKSHHRNR